MFQEYTVIILNNRVKEVLKKALSEGYILYSGDLEDALSKYGPDKEYQDILLGKTFKSDYTIQGTSNRYSYTRITELEYLGEDMTDKTDMTDILSNSFKLEVKGNQFLINLVTDKFKELEINVIDQIRNHDEVYDIVFYEEGVSVEVRRENVTCVTKVVNVADFLNYVKPKSNSCLLPNGVKVEYENTYFTFSFESEDLIFGKGSGYYNKLRDFHNAMIPNIGSYQVDITMKVGCREFKKEDFDEFFKFSNEVS